MYLVAPERRCLHAIRGPVLRFFNNPGKGNHYMLAVFTGVIAMPKCYINILAFMGLPSNCADTVCTIQKSISSKLIKPLTAISYHLSELLSFVKAHYLYSRTIGGLPPTSKTMRAPGATAPAIFNAFALASAAVTPCDAP